MNSNHPTLGNGKICYLEIPAMDVNVSSIFYRDVFGWNTRQRSDGHLSFDDGVNEVSGAWVLGRKPLSEAGLLVYIMVDSVEETIRKILSSGGKIVQPPGADAPDHGKIHRPCRKFARSLSGTRSEPVQTIIK